MARTRRKRSRYLIPLAIVGIVLVWLLITIDDWSRDFTTNWARIAADSGEPRLRPVVSELPAAEMVEAVKAAAGRIRDWEYVGEAGDGDTTMVVFVRTSKVFRFKDDIAIRVEDLGDRRVIEGESRSRVGKGDLGQNPRSLRRFLAELQTVLDSSAP